MAAREQQVGPAAGEQVDRIAILDAISRERAARDAGDWNALARAYTEDSLVELSWFRGTGAEFAKASAGMADKIFSFHEVGGSVVDVNGERALGNTSCTIHLIGEMEGVEVDVLGYIRSRARLRRESGRWRMAGLKAVYIHDLIVPIDPSKPPKVPDKELGRYRKSYRSLCHILVGQGLPARDDLPGVDKPETVQALLSSEEDWLSGGS